MRELRPVLLLLVSVCFVTCALCDVAAPVLGGTDGVTKLVAKLDAEYAAKRAPRDAFVRTAQRVSALVDAFLHGESEVDEDGVGEEADIPTEGIAAQATRNAQAQVQQLLAGPGRTSLPSLLLYSAGYVKNAVQERSERLGRRLSLLAKASRLAVGLDAWDAEAEALLQRRNASSWRHGGLCETHPQWCRRPHRPSSSSSSSAMPPFAPPSSGSHTHSGWSPWPPRPWPTWNPSSAPQPGVLSSDSISSGRSTQFNCVANEVFVIDGLTLECKMPYGPETITSRTYAMNADTYRGYCKPKGKDKNLIFERCVCPIGTVTVMKGNSMECMDLDVDIDYRVAGAVHCYEGVLGTGEGQNGTGNDFCLSTSRTANLALPVEMQFRYLTVAEMVQRKRTKIHTVPDNYTADTKFILEYTYNPKTYSYNEAIFYEYETYYCLYHRRLMNASFNIAATHSIVAKSDFFQGIFAFDHPELIPSQLKKSMMNCWLLDQWFGDALDNVGRLTWQLPVSKLPSTFIEGGQMYAEMGFVSPAVGSGVNALRLHLSFTDLPDPGTPYDYDHKFNKGYIALIIVCCLVGSAVIASVVWQLCASYVEPEDDLVSQAQRKKEIRAHHEKKSQ